MRAGFFVGLGFALLTACSSTAPTATTDGGPDGGPDSGMGGPDGGGPVCDGGCPSNEQCVNGGCYAYSCDAGSDCPTGLECIAGSCGSSQGCPSCLPSQVCVAGQCVNTSPCGAHESICDPGLGAYCANLNQDSHNCGGCGNECQPGEDCARGQCGPSCLEGEVACTFDGGALCAEVQTDNANCGACNNLCPNGKVCTAGECATSCAAPTEGTCGSGDQAYCADLQDSPFDCGTCGNQCGAGQYCSEGQCATRCQGLTDQLCSGICVDLQSDLENCGACGTACTVSQVCYGSACTATCGPPDTTCVVGGRDVCANLLEDTANCGACGNACAPGQVCADGVCAASCIGSAGTLCNGVCVHLASDDLNCGACGASCPSGEYCNGVGVCASTCTTGYSLCGSGTAAACVSFNGDPDNCGACGHTCGAGGTCVGGVCGGGDGGVDGGGDAGLDAGEVCTTTCEPGFACFGASCLSQTCASSSCPTNFACLDGGCIAPLCLGVTCPTGQGCGNGDCYPESCGSTSCDGGLCVDGSCVSPDCAGITCPTNEVCAQGQCVGSCTGCSVPDLCIDGACVPGCSISGVDYANGAINPADSCENCQASTNPTGWTSLTGNTCAGPSNYCQAGTCTEFCTIGGVSYANGQSNPADVCQVCDTSTNPLGWSASTNNLSCGDGGADFCENGLCLAGCVIAGEFVQPGANQSGDVCQACEPQTSNSGYSPAPDGTGCGGQDICLGGICKTGCRIDGGFYGAGEVDPITGQGCGICTPADSLTSWTPITGPVPGTGGGCADESYICDNGACTHACDIGGSYIDAGAITGLTCCSPSRSTSAWSPLWTTNTFQASGVGSLGIGDFDSKNGVDLAIGDQGGNLEILLNNGDGTFGLVKSYSTGLTSGGDGLQVADFNGDGILDVAVSNGDEMVIMIGAGDGSFSVGATSSANYLPLWAVGHLLGSGSPIDLVGQAGAGQYAGDLEVVSYTSGSGFSLVQALSLFPQLTGGPLATGDMNGDGRPDLTYPSNGSIVEYLNDGTHPFTTAKGYGSSASGYTAIAQAPFSKRTYNSTGAPILDVVAASQNNANPPAFDFYKNDGTGVLTLTKTTVSSQTTSTSFYELLPADFNGDGNLDLAVVSYGGTDNLFLYYGDGTGSFSYQGSLGYSYGSNYPFAETTLAGEPAIVSLDARSGASATVYYESSCH